MMEYSNIEINPICFFKKKEDEYFSKFQNKDDSVEFAFYDLKNKFKDNLDIKILLELPELKEFLYRRNKGDETFFHFGKKNSQISHAIAELSQKFI